VGRVRDHAAIFLSFVAGDLHPSSATASRCGRTRLHRPGLAPRLNRHRGRIAAQAILTMASRRTQARPYHGRLRRRRSRWQSPSPMFARHRSPDAVDPRRYRRADIVDETPKPGGEIATAIGPQTRSACDRSSAS
jgi:hypothetical protein